MRLRLLLLLLLVLLAAANGRNARPKMVFSINPGRTGSFFLSHVLNTSSDIHAEHEWQPNMSGWALRQATLYGLNMTYENRCSYVDDDLRGALDALPPGVGWADASNMFVKTFCDCVIDAFSETHDIQVVWLRRYLPATVASWQRHRVMDFPNALSLLWNYTPHSPAQGFSLTTPVCAWEDCSPDELVVMALLEHEARGLWFRRTYPQIPVVEVRLEEVATEQGARYMMDRLGLRYSPEELRAVVQENRDKLPPARDARPRCAALRRARDQVLAYVAEAGPGLPPLPHMVPVNEACDMSLADDSTHGPGEGDPLALLSPKPGSVMALGEGGQLEVFVAVRTPFGHRRPPLHVERHWGVRMTVTDAEGVEASAVEFDTHRLRLAGVSGEPMRLRAGGGWRSGVFRLEVAAVYYDVEDVLFRGAHQNGLPPLGPEREFFSVGAAFAVVTSG